MMLKPSWIIAGALLAAAPLQAQRSDSVLPEHRPPPGMCRIWLKDVPANRQPEPTDCATAIRKRPANGRVIFGEDPRRGFRDDAAPVVEPRRIQPERDDRERAEPQRVDPRRAQPPKADPRRPDRPVREQDRREPERRPADTGKSREKEKEPPPARRPRPIPPRSPSGA